MREIPVGSLHTQADALGIFDPPVLGAEAAGVPLERHFVRRLPEHADPGGKLGEFPPFAFAGGPFRRAVDFTLSPPRRFVQEIRTTRGPQTCTYWRATPQQVG